MTQGFDEWIEEAWKNKEFWKSHTESAKIGYEAGAASRQAEIDELQKRLAMYERQGYKLVPVEINNDIESATLSSVARGEMPCDIYKAMVGAVE